jgi:hypothetical protein
MGLVVAVVEGREEGVERGDTVAATGEEDTAEAEDGAASMTCGPSGSDGGSARLISTLVRSGSVELRVCGSDCGCEDDEDEGGRAGVNWNRPVVADAVAATAAAAIFRFVSLSCSSLSFTLRLSLPAAFSTPT